LGSNQQTTIDFYSKELDSGCAILVEYIEDLSNQVANSSKRDPFFFNFSKEKVSEREFYHFCLLIGGYLRTPGKFFEEESIERSILIELREEVYRISRRFKDTKFFKFFYFLLDTPLSPQLVPDSKTPSPREYLGNYKIRPEKGINRIFTLRYQTPRRVKRAEFRRGYRDHGSMSSISERARKAANTWNPGGNYQLELEKDFPSNNFLPLELSLVELESIEYLQSTGSDLPDHDLP